MTTGHHISPDGRRLFCSNVERCPFAGKYTERIDDPATERQQQPRYNNETIGISVEIAIAKAFKASIDPKYEERASAAIAQNLIHPLRSFFKQHSIPSPTKHLGMNQNPVDFISEPTGTTFSIKSNHRGAGKQAPQEIGQPSAKTHFEKLSHLYVYDPIETEARKELFKKEVIRNPKKFLDEYWSRTFECDYSVLVYAILDKTGSPATHPEIVALPKQSSPVWNNSDLSFTNSFSKDSTTLKYLSTSIGEFQTHRNRDNLKFRWNFGGLIELAERNEIPLRIVT